MQAFWDERYAANGFAFGTQPNDFLVTAVTTMPRGKVLCLGEGEGRNAVFLAKQGFSVTAVDISPVGLEKARNLAQEQGVVLETIVADLADFVIEPQHYSAIVSIFCHLPPDVRHNIYSQVAEGLKPGGVFVLEAYTPKQLEFQTGGPRDVAMLLTTAQVLVELPGLSFSVLQEVERDIHEGAYHNGKSAVVQAIGRKL